MDDIAFCQLLTYHNVIITSHQVLPLATIILAEIHMTSEGGL
jgi:hypothetical protein